MTRAVIPPNASRTAYGWSVSGEEKESSLKTTKRRISKISYGLMVVLFFFLIQESQSQIGLFGKCDYSQLNHTLLVKAPHTRKFRVYTRVLDSQKKWKLTPIGFRKLGKGANKYWTKLRLGVPRKKYFQGEDIQVQYTNAQGKRYFKVNCYKVYTYNSHQVYSKGSFVVAIVAVALTCMCWIFGAKQYPLMVSTTQQAFLPALLASRAVPNRVFKVTSEFNLHLFSAIPDFGGVSEVKVNYQPRANLYTQDFSGNFFNQIKTVWVEILAYLLVLGFLHVTKLSSKNCFHNWKEASAFFVPFLSNLTYISTVVLLSLGSDNYFVVNSFSAGTAFLLGLITFSILLSKMEYFWDKSSKNILTFTRFYVFSRDKYDESVGLSRLKKILFAVIFDHWKIVLVTLSITNLQTRPGYQPFAIFLFYLVSSLYLWFVRPYPFLPQNILQACIETFFTLVYFLLWLANYRRDSFSTLRREKGLGFPILFFLFLIGFFTVILFILPVLKTGKKTTSSEDEVKEEVSLKEEDKERKDLANMQKEILKEVKLQKEDDEKKLAIPKNEEEDQKSEEASTIKTKKIEQNVDENKASQDISIASTAKIPNNESKSPKSQPRDMTKQDEIEENESKYKNLDSEASEKISRSSRSGSFIMVEPTAPIEPRRVERPPTPEELKIVGTFTPRVLVHKPVPIKRRKLRIQTMQPAEEFQKEHAHDENVHHVVSPRAEKEKSEEKQRPKTPSEDSYIEDDGIFTKPYIFEDDYDGM